LGGGEVACCFAIGQFGKNAGATCQMEPSHYRLLEERLLSRPDQRKEGRREKAVDLSEI